MIFSTTKTEPPLETASKPVEETTTEDTNTPPPTPVGPIGSRGPVAVRKKDLEKKTEPPAPVVVVVEAPIEEKPYPADWEAKLGPPPAGRPAPQADPKASSVVRRVSIAGEEGQLSSIAAAFSRSNDLVEIADVGPFFEDDCQVAGKSRLIRAKGGRPADDQGRVRRATRSSRPRPRSSSWAGRGSTTWSSKGSTSPSTSATSPTTNRPCSSARGST